MAVPVLVITPTPGFGELLRQSLEEAGDYTVALATSGNEVVEEFKQNVPALCILDAGLDDGPLDKLVQIMRKRNEDLLVVLIPPEDDSEKDVSGVRADTILDSPFYLPNLIDSVEEVIKQSGLEGIDRAFPSSPSAPTAPEKPSKASTASDEPAPEWLKDVDQAAQHLASLSLESASQAALITRGEELWAYAGELGQESADELAKKVAQYWAHDGGSDLARFVRLDSTKSEHMMYATSLGDDFVLSLAFDATTPFSKIRSQAGQLARSLSKPLAELETDTQEVDVKEKTAPPVEEDIDVLGDTEATFEEVGARIVWELEEDYEEEEKSSPLLEDVPPSIPEDWVPSGMPANSRRDFLNDLLSDSPAGQAEGEIEGEEMQVAVDYEDYYADREVDLDATKVSISDPGVETVVSEAAKDESLAETIRSRTNQEQREKAKFEPVSPAMYHLTYACVLIPRFPEHHLTGELASQLSDWVTHICLAFGWRLEHLAIRPDYLQWIVNVPPTTTPGYFMRIIRRHTSRRLYAEFSYLEERNPSGDFWAPGYLIMSGDQSTPAHLIQEFIQQTRERQGVSRAK